jgi:hypothetical protein
LPNISLGNEVEGIMSHAMTIFERSNLCFLYLNVGFQFSAAFLRININGNILLASIKTLTNSKDFTESRIRILFQLPISVIG